MSSVVGSFPGSIQAALGICSLAGHLVSWQIAQTSMPPWPNAALEVPLQMCMEAIHIFPFKERRMLPVMEKLNRSCYIINTNTIYLFVYCSKKRQYYIYIYNIYLKNIQYASVYIMTCIRGNNLPKCECLKMRTPSIFKSLLNPLLEGFFNPTTNQPTNPPTNPRPSQPTSISHLILYICNILGRCWLFRQVCFRLIARKVCLRKWGIMSFTFGKKLG